MAAEGGSDLESSLTKNSNPGVPLKVILLGVKGVGKTTLFRRIFRFQEKDASDERYSNITDFFNQPIKVKGKTVQMQLWDTAGMEGNKHERNLTRSYYLGTQVALLVYSADDWDSVEDLTKYVEDVKAHAPGAKKFLIRNKTDLPRIEQTVNEQDVDGMFKQHGHVEFETNWKLRTSAITGEGIDILLDEIGDALLRQGTLKPNARNSFQVYKAKPKPHTSSKCC